MDFVHPFNQKIQHIENTAASQFLVIHSDDKEQVENLAVLFPKLTSLIKNNENKNFLLNFRDQEQRSIIVMVVAKNASASIAS